VEGDNTPQWDANGFVTGLDNTGTMINDLKRFLDAASSRDIVVIPVLWNGAAMRNSKVVDLVWDDSKLQSYIDNALIVSNTKTLNSRGNVEFPL
jgi:mannan endo-1,4-beta-mannosidase